MDEHTQRPQVGQRPMSQHIVQNANLGSSSGGGKVGDPSLQGHSHSQSGHGNSGGGQGGGHGGH